MNFKAEPLGACLEHALPIAVEGSGKRGAEHRRCEGKSDGEPYGERTVVHANISVRDGG